MKKIIPSVAFLLCWFIDTTAQITVDYHATSEKTESHDFSGNFTVDVTGVDTLFALQVHLPDGNQIDIDNGHLHSAVYDAGSKTLKIEFKISGNTIFLEANDRSNISHSATVTLTKGREKLLTIKKAATPSVPSPAAPAAPVAAAKFAPTGYALMDALSLMHSTKRSEVVEILKVYLGDSVNLKNVDRYLLRQNNKYLKDPAVIALIQEKDDDNRVVGSASDIAKKAIAAVGGLDVTSFADGLANFLVKRTKEELSTAFFTRFKKEMEKPEYKDLRLVFPETHRTLKVIGEDIYMFQAYIQALREAFQTDLSALLTNLPGIIDNHTEFFEQQPELKAVLLSAFYVGRRVQSKSHPGEIIEHYPIDYVSDFANVKASFQTLKLISGSLKDDSSDGYWAGSSTLKELTAGDGLLLKLYLGLLQAQSDSIVFFDAAQNPIRLSDIIDAAYTDVASNAPAYRKYFSELSDRLSSLETSIRNLEGSRPDSVEFENYYAVVSQSVDLMRYISDVETLPRFPKNLRVRDAAAKYFDAITAAAGMAVDIHRRNYASAIMDAVYLYNLGVQEFHVPRLKQTKFEKLKMNKQQAELGVEKAKDIIRYYEIVKEARNNNTTATDVTSLLKAAQSLMEIKKLNIEVDVVYAAEIAQSILAGKDADYLAQLLTQEANAKVAFDKALKELTEFVRAKLDTLHPRVSYLMMKYGSFMAAVVKAKTSDDIAAAIETVALPAGSSSIKRTVKFNVALNSFVGLHYGNEYIDTDGTTPDGWGTIFGVSAPIGVAGSFRLGKKAGSLSAFASLIDIGAVASFRFKDDVASELPPIKLENIFAPGLYAVYNIPQCPISIGYGWQKGPQLREVSIPDPDNPGQMINKNVSSNGYRWNFFIAVDIPILNFYSVGR